MDGASGASGVLLTLGHGTLATEELLTLLTGAGVEQLVDVRRFPGSRRHPHLARAALEQSLPAAGIGYRWAEALGGRRRGDPAEADRDPWWRVAQFRAYAAYTRTPEFRAALEELLAEAARTRTVVLCSESVWWRCHRRLVADVAVLLHDVDVRHLMHDGRLVEHPPSAGARVTDEGLVYDRTDA